MSHDEIADSVEDFDPVSIGLFHVGEQTGILQCDRSVTGNGLQELVVVCGQRLSAIRKAKHPDHFARSPEQPHQGTVTPFQILG